MSFKGLAMIRISNHIRLTQNEKEAFRFNTGSSVIPHTVGRFQSFATIIRRRMGGLRYTRSQTHGAHESYGAD